MKTTRFVLALAFFLTPRPTARGAPLGPCVLDDSDSTAPAQTGLPCRGDDPEAPVPPRVEAPQPIIQSGHAAAITTMAFSPHSTLLATGSADGTVKLWSVQTGQLLRTFIVSAYWVHSLAFSPKGCLLAAGSGDHKVYVWNLDTGAQLTTLEQHAGAVKALAFSSDATLLASGSTGVGTNPPAPLATIWEVGSWQKLFQLNCSTAVLDVTFIPGSETLAIALGERHLLWKYRTDRVENDHEGHPEDVARQMGYRVAARSPNGAWLAYSSGQDIHFQSLKGPEQRPLASSPSVAVTAVQFSASGNLLAVGLRGGQISVWDKELGAPVRTVQYAIESIPSSIRSLHLESEPDALLSAGADGGILRWTLSSVQAPELVRPPARGARAISTLGTREELGLVLPEPPRAVMASVDGVPQTLSREEIFATALSGTGPIAYGGYYFDSQTHTGFASVTDLHGQPFAPRIMDEKRYGQDVTALSFSPDGSILAMGFEQGGIDLWSTTQKTILTRLDGHTARINALAFSPDGEILASASSDKTVRLWNPKLVGPARILEGHGSAVLCVSFSGDKGGGLLASGGADNKIFLWNVDAGRMVRPLEGHSSAVNSLAFAPQRRLLVSGAEDGTVRFWDTSADQLLATMLPVGGGTDWLATTSNGFFDGKEETWGQVLWQFNGNLFDVSPVEIGFRDYFVPKLLNRILSGQPPAASRSLAALNRAQPLVRILSVTPDSPGTVQVDVEVESATSRTQKREGGNPLQSGAYDLRVFRNRQLVGRWPNVPEKAGVGSDQALEDWRRMHAVPLRPDGKATVSFTRIRLPHDAGTGKTEFTAYAFNNDRVKSLNSAPLEYRLQPPRGGAARRAYLITMGVNANESRWNLDVAVSSAEQARSRLHARLLKEYPTVVDIPLYSDLADDDQVRLKNARKAELKAALDLLSGTSVEAKLRDEIDSKHQLQTATPDDAVVLYVASHGYADPNGTLYLVPYDTGASFGITEEVLTRCLSRPTASAVCQQARHFLEHSISSSDLSAWWQGVDAGELIMILDSCHSGAAPGKEFRPGPLGDPGFGQLSYDKRMRLLSASQPTQTELGVWVSGGEGGTLLVEALETVAHANPQQTLAEWLKGAERQLPITMKQLYPEVREDDLQLPLLLDFGAPAKAVSE